MTSKRHTKNVGILGAGQLALMLSKSARALGHNPLSYAGALSDETALKIFLLKCDLIVFENEFVDCARLAACAGGRDLFQPPLSVIETFQDKLEQKRVLAELSIPTARFTTDIPAASSIFGPRYILKWARMGYDGKGVLFVDAGTPKDQIEKFRANGRAIGAEIYAEARVDFKRELALVASHGTNGAFVSYPLVVSEQEHGICKRVYGPATSMGVSPETEKTVEAFALKLARGTGLVGTFALELFETAAGEILVNEIAPRVHNTGHYTIDACQHDQFENHWRAVLGLELLPPLCAPAFAMRNILGPSGVTIKEGCERFSLGSWGGVAAHWYGKSAIVPRRKLGHLNIIGRSIQEIPSMLEELERCHENWEKGLRRRG